MLRPGRNVFLWAIGPAWGIAALAATAWCIAGRRADAPLNVSAARVAALWIPILFLFHGTQFVATVRYFLPMVPMLAVATAAWLTSWPVGRRAGSALLAAIVVCTAVWAVAFTSIYRRPHSRVAASAWIYDNVTPGATIATEHWDDALPLALGRRTADLYPHLELKLYDEENEVKRRELIDTLDRSNVIVLSMG